MLVLLQTRKISSSKVLVLNKQRYVRSVNVFLFDLRLLFLSNGSRTVGCGGVCAVHWEMQLWWGKTKIIKVRVFIKKNCKVLL